MIHYVLGKCFSSQLLSIAVRWTWVHPGNPVSMFQSMMGLRSQLYGIQSHDVTHLLTLQELCQPPREDP